MKKILLVTYGGGHSAIINPILNEFKNEKIELVCLALTGAYESLRHYNEYDSIQIKKISSYSNLFNQDLPDIKYWGNFIVNTMDKKKIIDLDESILYLGLSMLELVRLYGSNKAVHLYKEGGRTVFLPEIISRKILKFERPDIVFATNSPRMEKSIILAAIHLKIKNFQINDLFGYEAINIVSENIIVMNDFVKKEVELKRKCNLYTLGQPALEATYNKIRNIDENLLKKNNSLDSEKINITFFTQQLLFKDKNGVVLGLKDNDIIINTYYNLFKKLRKYPQFEIFLRTHPNQDASIYNKLLKLSKHLNPIMSSFESIKISDIVIIQDSTIGLEALISNKIVFTFEEEGNLSPNYKRPPFNYFSNIDNLFNSIINFEKFKSLKSNVINLPLNSAKKIKQLLINSL